MMRVEFLAAGANEITNEMYSKVEDIYTAYVRFDTKKSIADFWNEYGEDGVEALSEPLDKYRSLKQERSEMQGEINALLRQIKALHQKQAELDKKMKAVEMQCGLSWHWAKWA